MSLLFTGIPREIRDRIYELLLVKDRGEAIEFIEWNNEYGYGRVSGLQPKILRTCKQAHAEGQSVLYEKNNFNYKSYVGKGCSIDIADPLKGNFSKVKHFKLTHFVDAQVRDVRDYTAETYLRSADRSPSTTMRFLATAGCMLKTLDLEFRLSATPGINASLQDRDTIECLAHSVDLIRNIAAVAVGRRITLSAKGYVADDCNSFEHMAKSVGLIKQWTIVEDLSETRQGTWEILVRTWILEPTTVVTMEEVSSSDT